MNADPHRCETASERSAVPLAKVVDGSFGYGKAPDSLLCRVTLRIDPGRVVGLRGDNGIGKSTLFGILTGRLRLRGGTATVFGRPASARHHLPALGYLGDLPHFEGTTALPPELTVEAVLRTHRQLLRFAGQDAGRAAELEQMLELDDPKIRRQQVGSLSKGQHRRLQIVLTLTKDVRLLLADEPLEGLDDRSRELSVQLIHRVVKERNVGVLYVSHHFEELSLLADEIHELRERRLQPWGGAVGFDATISIDGGRQLYRGLRARDLLNVLGRALQGAQATHIEVVADKTSPTSEENHGRH